MQIPWYYHVAANAYQHRKKIKTFGKAYASYKALNMLRGTRNKAIYKALNTRPTLQNQITALSRQVALQKPEIQHWRWAGNYNSGTQAGQTLVELNATDDLIQSTNFRQNVTGDQWRNKVFKYKINFEPNCLWARVVIYVPKKAGDRFQPTAYTSTSIPDPSQFWVISDRFYKANNTNRNYPGNATVNLRNMKTIYDSQVTAIEKGELMMAIFTETNTQNTLSFTYGYNLTFTNL